MNVKNRRMARGLVTGAVLLGFVGATPAYAEGSWSSFISGWTPGKESRRWTDNNTDSVSTSVSFRGCASDGGTGFRQAGLKLWKDVFGPDEDQGTKSNTCNTVYWGDKASGTYYFELWSVTSGGQLSVNSVTTRY
jgi:hypothetical protein